MHREAAVGRAAASECHHLDPEAYVALLYRQGRCGTLPSGQHGHLVTTGRECASRILGHALDAREAEWRVAVGDEQDPHCS